MNKLEPITTKLREVLTNLEDCYELPEKCITCDVLLELEKDIEEEREKLKIKIVVLENRIAQYEKAVQDILNVWNIKGDGKNGKKSM